VCLHEGDSNDATFLDNSHCRRTSRGRLYLGDGTQRQATNIQPVITAVAGNRTTVGFEDGGPALQAGLVPQAVAVGPDGTLYVGAYGAVVRVSRDGTIHLFAGGGTDYTGADGPATQAKIAGDQLGLAVGSDGSVYISQYYDRRVSRVTPDGMLHTVAGVLFGQDQQEREGVPATESGLDDPTDVAIGSDGTLYITCSGSRRVRAVRPDGIITTVAGNGLASGPIGDGGPAVTAALYEPTGLAVGPDDSLYISDDRLERVRRVRPDGTITTVAGNGHAGTAVIGDGGPAVDAELYAPEGLTVGPDGSIWIADGLNQRIRRVTPDGIIATAAGNSDPSDPSIGENGPAVLASLNWPRDVALSPDGSAYVAD